jgi:hypothetical protein
MTQLAGEPSIGSAYCGVARADRKFRRNPAFEFIQQREAMRRSIGRRGFSAEERARLSALDP